MSLTSEQVSNYLKIRGVACPYCGSPDIQGDSVEIEAGEAYQTIDCANCSGSWLDCYVLTGIEAVQEPEADYAAVSQLATEQLESLGLL